MSKDLPYFRFTAFEWLNDDISLESYETKGVFIDICAYYWFQNCSLTKAKLKQRFSNASASIEALIKSQIIKVNDETDFIEISFLNYQFDQLSQLRKVRQDAGRKGGKQSLSKPKAKHKQNGSYKDKDNNKDKDKDKDKDKERNIIPPTLEMVKSYCDKRNNGIDPQYFIDRNTAIGWTYNNGKIKITDWQAHMRTWEKHRKPEQKVMMP